MQGDDGTAQPVMLMHNSGRPTDGSVKADGVKTGNVLVGTEEDFRPRALQRLRRQRPDRAVGPHRLPRRRAGLAVDAREAVPDEDARLVPSVPRHARDHERGAGLLGALLRDRGPDAGRRLVRPGPAPARHLRTPTRVVRSATTASPARAADNPSSNSWDVAFRSGAEEGQEGRTTWSTCSTCRAASRSCASTDGGTAKAAR